MYDFGAEIQIIECNAIGVLYKFCSYQGFLVLINSKKQYNAESTVFVLF